MTARKKQQPKDLAAVENSEFISYISSIKLPPVDIGKFSEANQAIIVDIEKTLEALKKNAIEANDLPY